MKNKVLISGKAKLLLGTLGLMLLSVTFALAQDHPARVSAVEGRAAIAGESYADWSEVVVNLPVWKGDRIVLQQESQVEVELNEGGFLRLAPGTDIIFRMLSKDHVELKLLLGALILRTHSSTPYAILSDSATIYTQEAGLYHISVSELGKTVVSVRKGVARAVHEEGALELYAGDSFISGGGDYPTAEAAQFADDDFTYWSDRRDAGLVPDHYSSGFGYGGYAGAAALHRYGQWGYVSSYGRVWWPSVQPGWIPYQQGRWIHHPRRGFVWVSYEPWGWLPYHYGQWSYIPYYSRWCWVPGGFSSWSPALVNFYHGNGFVGWSPYGFQGTHRFGRPIGPHTRIPGLTLVPRGRFLGRPISPNTVVRLHGNRGLRSGLDPSVRAFVADSESRRAARAGRGIVSRTVGPSAAFQRRAGVHTVKRSQPRPSGSARLAFSGSQPRRLTGGISRAFSRGNTRPSFASPGAVAGRLRSAGRSSVPRLRPIPRSTRGIRGIRAPSRGRSFQASRSFGGISTAFSRSRSIRGASRSRSSGGRSVGRIGRSGR